MDEGYPAIYYQTIRDTGIDPVVCGDISVSIGREGCTESGSVSAARAGQRPVQLAEKALAKAAAASAGAPRKRAPRKATAVTAAKGQGAEPAVPKQKPAKTARGTAKVASSG